MNDKKRMNPFKAIMQIPLRPSETAQACRPIVPRCKEHMDKGNDDDRQALWLAWAG